MSYLVEDTYEMYNEREFRARKEHQCDACKELVCAGDSYTRVFIRFEGNVESLKRCGRCQKLHVHLRGLDPDTWPEEKLNCGINYEDEWGKLPEEVAALAFELPKDRES